MSLSSSALVAAGSLQISLPAADAGAHKFGDNVRVLRGKVARGELNAVRIVAGGADEQGADVCASLFGEEGLAGDEDLLHVVGVGEKVGDGEGGGNLANVLQVVAAE